MAQDHSTKHIVQSLAVNAVIATVKTAAAIVTGSGAMLAEAIHSAADCGNQGLLLFGVKQARKPPDPEHPLGYGRSLYFWSFMVALLLFSGGGVFSVYEGIHKLLEPEPVEHVSIGIGILIVSLLLEGGATMGNIRELNARRGTRGFFEHLRYTKDSDLVVVFGENSAAVLGLTLAIFALTLSYVTGDSRWDAVGSLAIGVVLIAVAIFLAIEVKSLLVGESADPEIVTTVKRLAHETKGLDRLLGMMTVQQGPGEVIVAIKLTFISNLSIEDVCKTINDFEANLRSAHPEVKWCFVEPDLATGPKSIPFAV